MTTLAMNKIVSRGKKQIVRTIGKADRTLLFILLALIVFGSVMVFSASTAYSSIRFVGAEGVLRGDTVTLSSPIPPYSSAAFEVK